MDAIERLLIEQECIRLMTDYNIHLDNLDVEAFVNVFAEDAIWSRAVPAPRIELCGHDALRQFIDSHMRPAPRLRRHMLANPRVAVRRSDEAEGFCIGLVVHGPKGDLPVPMGGVELVAEYRDVFCRLPQGWRIVRRELTRVIDLDAA